MRPEADTAGLNTTHIIFGLGNPGPEYAWTPHNAGFIVLDMLAAQWTARWDRLSGTLQVARVAREGTEVYLVKPQTYMNCSGKGLLALQEHLDFSWEHFCVVTDDWDLPVGNLRLRPHGGGGTHNGMRSLLEQRPEGDFPRVRVGIKPPYVVECLRDYVIGPLPPEEMKRLLCVCERAVEALTHWVEGQAWPLLMSRYNGPVACDAGGPEQEPLAPLERGLNP